MTDDRLLTPARRPDDVDAALRPKRLDEFVGQAAVPGKLRVFACRIAHKSTLELAGVWLLCAPQADGRTRTGTSTYPPVVAGDIWWDPLPPTEPALWRDDAVPGYRRRIRLSIAGSPVDESSSVSMKPRTTRSTAFSRSSTVAAPPSPRP